MDVMGIITELSRMRTARRRNVTLDRLKAERGGRTSGDPATAPPALTGDLIAVADRLADLLDAEAPTDLAEAVEALRWLQGRVDALMAACEVVTIVDDGALNFLRHEVVSDRPAPRLDLVDHIAATVRPGYRWRDDLLRPQQVVAYVAEG